MLPQSFLAPFVRSFFEDYLVCQRNVSHHTIMSYRDALKLFLSFAAKHLKKPVTQLLVTDIAEDVVTTFLADLEYTRNNSIQTRNHRLHPVRALFEYIAEREPLHLEHCRRLVTIPKKRGALVPGICYLEKDQLSAILNAALSQSAKGCRDYSLLLFMYNTGARVQEVADTRISWLTLTLPYKVDLLGKGRKWRACPLWENTVQNAQKLMEERRLKVGQDDFLFVNRFGQKFSRSGIADIVERHTAQAAITTPGLQGKKITPHTFRHTTAMHLLQSGVEVNVIRSWLGHVSIATTSKYIEIDLAMKRKAMETCEVGANEVPATDWRSNPDILTWLESL